MLYNTKWNKDIFSVGSLTAWLETQPPEQKYDYMDNCNCLAAQYFRAMGKPTRNVGGYDIDFVDGTHWKIPGVWMKILNGPEQLLTMGGALAKAQKVKPLAVSA
jgi:hypothetical protein